jgi:hypothetical protein
MDAITWSKVPNRILGGYTLELRVPGHEPFKRVFTDQELDAGVPELEEARELLSRADEVETAGRREAARPRRERIAAARRWPMATGRRTGKMAAFRLRCEAMRRVFPEASDALPA